jgi:hypothetical protein
MLRWRLSVRSGKKAFCVTYRFIRNGANRYGRFLTGDGGHHQPACTR